MSLLSAARRERLAAGVLVGLAVVFVGVALVQRMHRGDTDALLPLALLAADLTIAAALLSGWYSVRPVAQGLAIFGALAHVLLLLGGRPELIRVTSGLLAAAHVYSLVLLFQLGVGYDYEDDEQEAVAVVAAPVDQVPLAEATSVEPIAVEGSGSEISDAEVLPDAGITTEEPEPGEELPKDTVEEQDEPTEPEGPGEVPTVRPEAGQNGNDQNQPTRDQPVPVTTTVGAEEAPASEEPAR